MEVTAGNHVLEALMTSLNRSSKCSASEAMVSFRIAEPIINVEHISFLPQDTTKPDDLMIYYYYFGIDADTNT
jgi:hypothetical protein